MNLHIASDHSSELTKNSGEITEMIGRYVMYMYMYIKCKVVCGSYKVAQMIRSRVTLCGRYAQVFKFARKKNWRLKQIQIVYHLLSKKMSECSLYLSLTSLPGK